MANQTWLDEVRERLVKQALPPAYIRRFMDELSDHFQDLTEENMSTESAASRLGDPKQVSEKAVAAYRQRSFIGRHPVAVFLVFAVSPILSQYFLVVFGQILFGRFSGNPPYQEHSLALSLTILAGSTFLALYGELAMWLGIGKKWMLASSIITGLMAMWWEFAINFGSDLRIVRILVQFAVPLAVGWWFAKRNRSYNYPVTSFFVFAISPFVSFMILWFILSMGTLAIVTPSLVPGGFIDMHLPHTAYLAVWYAVIFLTDVLPAAVVSLLYCKLAKWLCSDRRWMLISSIAVSASMVSFRIGFMVIFRCFYGLGFPIGLTTYIILVQFLVPLAIGWWFMRRKHDRSQLQLAS